MKIKILFLSHSSQLGGAENHLLYIMKGLPKDKFVLHCIFPEHGPVEEKAKLAGVHTYIIKMPWLVSIEKNPIANILQFFYDIEHRIKSIVGIISENEIDLIYTNTIVIGDGAIAARLANKPHIWQINEMLSRDPALKAPLELTNFYKIILNLSEYIIADSKAVKAEIEDIIKFKTEKIKALYHSIQKLENSNETDRCVVSDKKFVFAAGTICRRKGFIDLLNAAKHVHSVFPEVKFIIAGQVIENDYYKFLISERKRLGLENIFKFVGFQKNIYPFLKNSSLFVLPSICEPLGLVLLEAMSMSKPIVTTNSGGPSEVVQDNVTGFVVPVNDPIKMAEKIIYLLNNEKIAIEMGRKGYERFKVDFSFENFFTKIEKIFYHTIKEYKLKRNYSNIELEDLVKILDNLGTNWPQFKKISNFYNSFHDSLPYRIYKRSGIIKKPIRSLLMSDAE